eukprot:11158671-Lingulodinium_polyedra.AAC.1
MAGRREHPPGNGGARATYSADCAGGAHRVQPVAALRRAEDCTVVWQDAGSPGSIRCARPAPD